MYVQLPWNPSRLGTLTTVQDRVPFLGDLRGVSVLRTRFYRVLGAGAWIIRRGFRGKVQQSYIGTSGEINWKVFSLKP